MPRYRVLDLPVQGAGAFVPQPFTNPIASSWGLVHVFGSPGTWSVPANNPGDTWRPTPNRGQLSQPSNVSPDVIRPSIYVASAANMGPNNWFGMAMRRHTPLPVPAVGWIANARNAMRSRKTGGRDAPVWPRAFQRWPAWGGRKYTQ